MTVTSSIKTACPNGKNRFCYFGAAVFLSLFIGCAGTSAPTYTFQDGKDLVKEEVQQQSSTVSVSYADLRGVHERLGDLFSRQLKLPLKTLVVESGQVFSQSSDRFIIQIRQKSQGDGSVLFAVQVTPRAPKDAEQAQLNQKILARYIQKGVFESSLFQL